MTLTSLLQTYIHIEDVAQFCEIISVHARLRLIINVCVVGTKGTSSFDARLGCMSVVGSGRWEWVPDFANKFRTGFQEIIKYIICMFNRVLSLYSNRFKLVLEYAFQ